MLLKIFHTYFQIWMVFLSGILWAHLMIRVSRYKKEDEKVTTNILLKRLKRIAIFLNIINIWGKSFHYRYISRQNWTHLPRFEQTVTTKKSSFRARSSKKLFSYWSHVCLKKSCKVHTNIVCVSSFRFHQIICKKSEISILANTGLWNVQSQICLKRALVL